MKARVLIEVSGGIVQNVATSGNVETCVIDWDLIADCDDDPPENWKEFADLRLDLRSEMDGLWAGRQLEFDF